MATTRDGFEYTHTFDPHGRYALGFIARLGSAEIRVEPGETEVNVQPVTLTTSNETRRFQHALEDAECATTWNAKAPRSPVSFEEARVLVKDVLAWANSEPTFLGTLSHHGINSDRDVIASGRAVRLRFAPMGHNALFMVYPESNSVEAVYRNWNLPEYDSSIIRDEIAKAIGAGSFPIQDWNSQRSMVFASNIHGTVIRTFNSYDQERKPQRPPLPKGWV